jgi:hypothetical protein
MTYSKEEWQAYDRAYREKNREKKVAQSRDWRHRHAEHMLEYWRSYYQANRDRILEQRKNGNTRKPEYTTWVNINQRCTNPNIRSYRWYGARGISVSPSWANSFQKFLADIGPRPSPKHSINRLNSNGNYEKSNCVWSDKAEQVANLRSNVVIEFNGKKQHQAAWSRETGLSEKTIHARRKKGLPPEKILQAA